MDGVADQIKLTAMSAGRFSLALPEDAGEIHRLLRENPMAGRIRLSLEPARFDPLHDGLGSTIHQTLVGRRPNGTLFGVGTRSVRQAYVNGQVTSLGYLGMLRLDADHRNSPRILLRGYEALRELHHADGACPFYLTSIMSDNETARRFLEAKLRGMPTYRFIGEFVSLVMRVRRRISLWYTPSLAARRKLNRFGLRMEHGGDDRMRAMRGLIDQVNPRYQYAPAWSSQDLPPALAPSDFRLALNRRDECVACAALWDQRDIRQTIVRGYTPSLARIRPIVNAFAKLTGRPMLPRPGNALRMAYVSHLASAENVTTDTLVPLVEALHAAASTRQIDYLIAGFPGDDPCLAALRRRFGGRELRSRLYLVHWPDGEHAVNAIDGRPARPEVALL